MKNLKEEFTVEELRNFFKGTEYFIPEDQPIGEIAIGYHRSIYQLSSHFHRTYWDVIRSLTREQYKDAYNKGGSEAREKIRNLINMP